MTSLSSLPSSVVLSKGYEPNHAFRPIPFNGKGFSDWKFRFECLADLAGCSAFLREPSPSSPELSASEKEAKHDQKEKGSKKPSSSSSPVSSASPSSPLVDGKETELKKWLYNMLVASVGESVLPLIRSVPRGDPLGVWKALLSHYERNTFAHKRQLRRELHSTVMKDNESFSVFAERINELVRVLTGMGEVISDADRAAALLDGLPKSFAPIVITIEALDKDYFSMVEMIKDFEQRELIHARRESTAAEAAFAAPKQRPRKEKKFIPLPSTPSPTSASTPSISPTVWATKKRLVGRSTPR
jgi:hypothetical protein